MIDDFLNQRLDQFFTELTRRELAKCREILDELYVMAPTQPEVAAWCAYFAAILVQEHDHDFAEAAHRYRTLLAIATLSPHLRGQVLISLAGALLLVGAYQEAVQAAKDAVDHYQSQQNWLEAAKAWAQLALLRHMGYNAGDFGAAVLQEGLTACQHALDLLAKEADRPAKNDIAVLVWNTLGLLYSNLLDWPKAIVAYEQLLAIATQTQNRFGASIAHSNLGLAYRKLGPAYWQPAEAALVAAHADFQALNRPYEQLTVLTQLALLYDERDERHLMHQAFTSALTLLESLRAGISNAEARAGFLAAVSDLLANAVLCYMRIGDLAQAFACMEQARARAFLDLLTIGAPELVNNVTVPTLSLAQVQQRLPADALLLVYFTTGSIDAPDRFTPPAVRADRPNFPRATTLLFAVTSTTITLHEIGLSPNDLYPANLTTPVEEYFLAPAMRQALYDLLLAPVATQLNGKTTIFLAPHGPLHYVPFQALLAPTGETLLNATGPRLVYTPSASILLHSQKRVLSSKRPGQQPGCLAIGYNGAAPEDNTDAGATPGSRVELRYAEDEAVTIAQLTAGVALIGPQPKKAQLLAHPVNFRWLHFSCHGDFNPLLPLASALYISASETLTAQEVLHELTLTSELVSLSACASGLSQVRRGDELYGLVRAFLYAGAAALLVTQWRVDERSTHLFMCKFYSQVLQGDDYALALQRAQTYLRTLTAHAASVVLTTLLDAPATKSPLLQADLQALRQRLRTLPPHSLPFTDPYYWAPFILIRG